METTTKQTILNSHHLTENQIVMTQKMTLYAFVNSQNTNGRLTFTIKDLINCVHNENTLKGPNCQ